MSLCCNVIVHLYLTIISFAIVQSICCNRSKFVFNKLFYQKTCRRICRRQLAKCINCQFSSSLIVMVSNQCMFYLPVSTAVELWTDSLRLLSPENVKETLSVDLDALNLCLTFCVVHISVQLFFFFWAFFPLSLERCFRQLFFFGIKSSGKTKCLHQMEFNFQFFLTNEC